MIRRVTFMDDLIMIRKRSKGKELEAGRGGEGSGGRGGEGGSSIVPPGLSNPDPV